MFWELNPITIKPFFKAEQIKRDNRLKEQSIVAYWNGIYVAQAVSLIGGCKFPEEPLKLYKTQEEIEKENRLPTEQEIIIERQKLINKLKADEINWKLSHPK